MIDLQWLHNHPTEVFECIANLEAENRELKSQAEQLRSACQLGIDMFIANDINVPNTIETMQEALDATPAQCPAEIKAQAVADVVNAHPEKIAYIEHYGQTRSRGDYCDLWLSSSDLIKYANQLRQQADKE